MGNEEFGKVLIVCGKTRTLPFELTLEFSLEMLEKRGVLAANFTRKLSPDMAMPFLLKFFKLYIRNSNCSHSQL